MVFEVLFGYLGRYGAHRCCPSSELVYSDDAPSPSQAAKVSISAEKAAVEARRVYQVLNKTRAELSQKQKELVMRQNALKAISRKIEEAEKQRRVAQSQLAEARRWRNLAQVQMS